MNARLNEMIKSKGESQQNISVSNKTNVATTAQSNEENDEREKTGGLVHEETIKLLTEGHL